MASSAESIPPDIQRFVLTSVPSVPFLEAALLLRREPERLFEAGAVARALYLPEQQVLALLDHLAEAGIVAAHDGPMMHWRYQPRDPALAQMLDRLAARYARDLIAVTNLIHDGVRKSAERFAEAFRIRKE